MRGSAVEAKGTRERSEQSKRLWEMNFPALHFSIEHSEERKAEWMEWASNIRHGGSYFLRALQDAPPEYFEMILAPWIAINQSWSDWTVSSTIKRQVTNAAYSDWLEATSKNYDDILVPPKPTFPNP